eukprot:2172654-Pyramimonas_sp.AAC.3
MEAMRVNKVREQTLNKLKQVEKQCQDLEKTKNELKSEISTLERDIELGRKLAEAERKKQYYLPRG